MQKTILIYGEAMPGAAAPASFHFRDCKVLLVTSLTHVSGAIANVHTFTFTFNGRDSVTQQDFPYMERAGDLS